MQDWTNSDAIALRALITPGSVLEKAIKVLKNRRPPIASKGKDGLYSKESSQIQGYIAQGWEDCTSEIDNLISEVLEQPGNKQIETEKD